MSSRPVLRIKNQPMFKPPLIAPSVRGLSLVAIRQDDVRFETENGPIDARLIKIMQFTSTPTVNSRRRRLPFQLNALHSSNLKAQSKPAPRHLARSESSKLRSPNQVTLRAVGEVLSDESGKLFEIRDDELHLLGKLVRNQMGRLFEICDSSHENFNPQTAINKAPTAFSWEAKTIERVNRSLAPPSLVRRMIECLRRFASLFASKERY